MDNNNFRKIYELKLRNHEYVVDRCDHVVDDIERQENYIQRVKDNTTKSDEQKEEDIDDTRLYQLTIIEKLLESKCKGREYIELIHQIFNILNTGMSNENDSDINKQIRLKLDYLLNARLRSTRRNNFRGGKSRRRKNKRTRRMRR